MRGALKGQTETSGGMFKKIGGIPAAFRNAGREKGAQHRGPKKDVLKKVVRLADASKGVSVKGGWKTVRKK